MGLEDDPFLLWAKGVFSGAFAVVKLPGSGYLLDIASCSGVVALVVGPSC